MKPRLNQTGQAVTEYILLLVLSVAIMLVVGNHIFTPLKQWTNFYLGTYTSCLLDYGVLPGSSGATVTECQKVAITAGMAGNNSQNNPNQSSTNNSSETAAQQAQKAAAQAEAERASSAAARRRAGAGGGGGGRRVVNQNGNDVNGLGKNEGLSDNTDENGSRSLYTSENLNHYRRNNRWDRNPEKKIKARGFSGTPDEIDKLARQGESRITKTDSDYAGRAAKRIPVNPPPPRKVASDSDQDSSFSIGNLFRIGIMVIIIVAIVFVVGSQLNSVSKSMDD